MRSKWRINLRTAGLMLFALLFAGHSAEVRPEREYRPLEWQWLRAEVRELKQLAAKTAANDDGSFSLETANWRICTWHTPLFTAQAGMYMEKFSTVFSKAFLLKNGRAFKNYKPLLCVYASRADYLRLSGAPEWSEGICQTARDSDGRYLPDITLHTYYEHNSENGAEPVFGDGVPLATIQHEGTHCLLQCLYGAQAIPLWLNEGAANYYGAWGLRWRLSATGETWNDSVHRANRVLFSRWPPVIRAYYQKHPVALPRLDELTAANTQKEFYCDNGGELTALNYALAESFIDFLMTNKKRRPFMLKILERVRSRPPSALGEKSAPFVTPEEALEYEEQWLVFLMQHWGVNFDAQQRLMRAAELRSRAKRN